MRLLNIARDGFRFLTKFFEVINVSAAHIYHSALELCPASSIIRKLYYHQRITKLPTVVIGTPESWAQSIGVSGKNPYDGPCIWSPCGRFVAAQMRKAVEIRNQLTLEPITTLRPTETIPHITGPLAYSPDGRSIACASDTVIIIWDIQTGGAAKEIKCSPKNTSLVWSSSGGTICTIDSGGRAIFIVRTYDVSSGTTSSPGTLQSRDNPHLWTVDESFRAMATVRDGYHISTIDIFKVGSTLTKIQSFSPSLPSRLSNVEIKSFSPTTHHISISDGHAISIVDIQTTQIPEPLPKPRFGLFRRLSDDFSSDEIPSAASRGSLLETSFDSLFHSFSSDGSLFAASQGNNIHIWRYASGHYTKWREFPCRGLSNSPLRFSPHPSSILGHSGDILRVWRLHELPTTPKSQNQQYVGLSRSGTRVATAYKKEKIVTIIDLLGQTAPQFISANMEIEGLALTGNVLLVAGLATGSRQLVARLLAEEGFVGDRRVYCSGSIWTIPKSRTEYRWAFQIEGQVGVIKLGQNVMGVYHTETGERLHLTQAPLDLDSVWNDLDHAHSGRGDPRLPDHLQFDGDGDSWPISRRTTDGADYVHSGQSYLRFHNLPQCNAPPEDSWQTSRATLREGWVKDSEGKHRFWVPIEWRADWDPRDWRHDATTQLSCLEGRPVLIKF